MAVQAHYALEAKLKGGTLRLWTGPGRLTLGGNAYIGGAGIVSVSAVSVSLDGGTDSFDVSIAAVSSDDLARWLEPQGPRDVTLRQVVQVGTTWTAMPHEWLGVLGSSSIQAGLYRATIVSAAKASKYQADGARWTGERQFRDTDGADTSLFWLKTTESEVKVKDRI